MSEFDFDAWMDRPINAEFDWSVWGQLRARGGKRITQSRARPAASKPTRHETAILRRVARGFLLATLCEDGLHFTYEDGTPVRSEKNRPLDDREFVRLKQFLVPESGDTLFETGQAQRWNARKPP